MTVAFKDNKDNKFEDNINIDMKENRDNLLNSMVLEENNISKQSTFQIKNQDDLENSKIKLEIKEFHHENHSKNNANLHMKIINYEINSKNNELEIKTNSLDQNKTNTFVNNENISNPKLEYYVNNDNNLKKDLTEMESVNCEENKLKKGTFSTFRNNDSQNNTNKEYLNSNSKEPKNSENLKNIEFKKNEILNKSNIKFDEENFQVNKVNKQNEESK